MGVGPLANPGHAGRDAGPEVVAVESKKTRQKGQRRQEKEIWVTYKYLRRCLKRKSSSGGKKKRKKGNQVQRHAQEEKFRGQGSGSFLGDALQPSQCIWKIK